MTENLATGVLTIRGEEIPVQDVQLTIHNNPRGPMEIEATGKIPTSAIDSIELGQGSFRATIRNTEFQIANFVLATFVREPENDYYEIRGFGEDIQFNEPVQNMFARAQADMVAMTVQIDALRAEIRNMNPADHILTAEADVEQGRDEGTRELRNPTVQPPQPQRAPQGGSATPFLGYDWGNLGGTAYLIPEGTVIHGIYPYGNIPPQGIVREHPRAKKRTKEEQVIWEKAEQYLKTIVGDERYEQLNNGKYVYIHGDKWIYGVKVNGRISRRKVTTIFKSKNEYGQLHSHDLPMPDVVASFYVWAKTNPEDLAKKWKCGNIYFRDKTLDD